MFYEIGVFTHMFAPEQLLFLKWGRADLKWYIFISNDTRHSEQPYPSSCITSSIITSSIWFVSTNFQEELVIFSNIECRRSFTRHMICNLINVNDFNKFNPKLLFLNFLNKLIHKLFYMSFNLLWFFGSCAHFFFNELISLNHTC